MLIIYTILTYVFHIYRICGIIVFNIHNRIVNKKTITFFHGWKCISFHKLPFLLLVLTKPVCLMLIITSVLLFFVNKCQIIENASVNKIFNCGRKKKIFNP